MFFTLEHFNLLRLLSPSLTTTDAPLTPEENVLFQEFLALVLKLSLNRSLIGLSETDKLRREVIAWLACGDLSAARLSARLSPQFRTAKASHLVDAALAQVAQSPSSHSSLMDEHHFRLRPEFWREIDPYFWPYRAEDIQKLEENYRQVR